MGVFESSRFVHGGRKLTGHAADAHHSNLMVANEQVDIARVNTVDNHIEDMHLATGFPKPSREVNVIQRDILDVSIVLRQWSNEGEHLGLLSPICIGHGASCILMVE